jgi:predicted nucleotidyltransferase
MHAIVDPTGAAEFAAAIVRRHLPDPAYQVFLFGSRAAGTAHDRSDIDIGIEGPVPVPREALAAIHEEIEEVPTLYSIDVVDFKRLPEKIPAGCAAANSAMTKSASLRADFERATSRLEEALVLPKDDIVRDSAIKRFEISFELCWKFLKAYLEEEHNVVCTSPRT